MTIRNPAPYLALLASIASAGTVRVVHDGPELNDAIAASSDGDIVLLESGVYTLPGQTVFHFAGRSVSLIADADADVELRNPLQFSFVLGATPIVVQGIDVASQLDQAAVFGILNTVPIWIEDCAFRRLPPPSGQLNATSTAFTLIQTYRLALHETRVVGALAPAPPSIVIAPALELGDCYAGLMGCEIVGADGAAATASKAAGRGNDAVYSAGKLYVAGSTLRGGNGGAGYVDAAAGACMPGGAGGSAMFLAEAPLVPPVDVLDCALVPGHGAAAAGSCGAMPDGAAIQGPLTYLQQHAGNAHDLDVTSPVREGGTLTWTLSGASGELAFLAHAFAPDWLPMPGIGSLLELGGAFFVEFAGVVPASGQLVGNALVGELGPGVDGAFVFLQGGVFDGTSVRLTSGAAALLLDQAI